MALDVRHAFLKAASTLVAGFYQLASFRIVSNTASICLLEVNVANKDLYGDSELPVISELREIAPSEYFHFDVVRNESMIVLAFSWLESFLEDVEAALFLTSPRHLGDNIHVKLGKILEVKSIEQLLHDLVRKKIRERSKWSLTNRLKDLSEHRSFRFVASESDFDFLSEMRNKIVHDRKLGAFSMERQRITYQIAKKAHQANRENIDRYLYLICNTIVDLYESTSQAIGINRRFKLHKLNLGLFCSWRDMWSVEDEMKHS